MTTKPALLSPPHPPPPAPSLTSTYSAFPLSALGPMTTFNDECSSLLQTSTASSECEEGTEGCPYILSLAGINGRAETNLFSYRCGVTYTGEKPRAPVRTALFHCARDVRQSACHPRRNPSRQLPSKPGPRVNSLT